jgi:hypothetical protein
MGCTSRLLADVQTFCLVTWSAALLFLSAHSRVQGQSVQADQAQLLKNQLDPLFAPSSIESNLAQNEVVSSPNDIDLGEQEILKRRYQPWMLSVTSPIFYTSNVALANRNVVSDVVEAPTAGIYYQPRITQTLYGNVDVRQQFFLYDKYTSHNFGSMDAEAGLNYLVPQFHNLILRGEYDFNLLTDSNFREFFENHAILINAEIPLRLGRAQQISFGTNVNISVAADHQFPRRNDYEAYVGYSVVLTRSFVVSALGRVLWRAYHQNDRTDLSELLSMTGSYRLNDRWTVSAISSFAWNESNHNVFDYEVANLCGTLSLSVKF